MAYWQRRRDHQVTVYYYDRESKKVRAVPREEVAHLDPLSDEEVAAWVVDWESSHGYRRVRSRTRALVKSDRLASLIQGFLDDHAAMRETKDKLRQDMRRYLEHYIVGYFVQQNGEKSVRHWWRLTPDFPRWLRSTYPRLHITTIKKIIQTLRRFGVYLATHYVIPQPWLLQLPRIKQRPQTPLIRPLSPTDVFSIAKKLEPKWKLMVLLGYFASMRPEEIYVLTRADFLTGERAKRDAKTHSRFARAGIGSGLSVAITRTKTREGELPLMKTVYSYGVVNVWSAEAAKEIAAVVRAAGDGPFFPGSRYSLDREFKRIVRPLLAAPAYDLRRASGLYLGREIGLDPLLLQDHFRHSSIQTTMLYTRRPLDEVEGADTQDFDDVV